MMRDSDFGSPFDFERMFERMNRQFEEMNRQFAQFTDARPALQSDSDRPAVMGYGDVRVDVAEHESDVVVTADLPGFEKEEIDLSIAGDALTIRAEHDAHDEFESDTYVRRERRHHAIRRTIPLPADVREEEASASYANGVLSVTLPKTELDDDEGSHHINIE